MEQLTSLSLSLRNTNPCTNEIVSDESDWRKTRNWRKCKFYQWAESLIGIGRMHYGRRRNTLPAGSLLRTMHHVKREQPKSWRHSSTPNSHSINKASMSSFQSLFREAEPPQRRQNIPKCGSNQKRIAKARSRRREDTAIHSRQRRESLRARFQIERGNEGSCGARPEDLARIQSPCATCSR